MNFFQWIFVIFSALLPALFWLVIWYQKDSADPEPKRMILRAFFLGMLGVVPFLVLRIMLDQSPNLLEFWRFFEHKSLWVSSIILAILLAGLEEFVKHFSVLRLGKSYNVHFDQILDGVIYSVSAALGFAFVENVVYFCTVLWSIGITSDFWSIFLFRSFGTMLGHTIFSGIFGYFWGYAFFSRKIVPKHSESVSHLWKRILASLRFHIIFAHIFRGRPSQQQYEKSDLVREGFLLATLVHAVFNVLLMSEIFGKNTTVLVVPLLLIGLMWISRRFLVAKNVRIWTAV